MGSYSILSLLEPKTAYMDAAFDMDEDYPEKDEAPTNTITYDFVIIGSGSAGRSAVHTLKEQCPNAKIAVIDPLRSTPRLDSTIDHYKELATGFNPMERTVRLMSDTSTQLQYKHGILLATGSRGAPPPLDLFENSCLSRVIELRTTEMIGNTKRPVLAPESVRKAIVDSTSKGAKVAILGSGWEALDLVCIAARQGRKTPTMVFGSQGPLWSTLPTYLSTELRKRLYKRGIDIQDRSVVRYVADVDRLQTKKIELHTAKIYDLLDTKRAVLDLLVIAPDSFGNKGTAALPTAQTPVKMRESSDGRPWYKTWSQLAKTNTLEPSVIVCFEDDGRVVVNAELCAASKVYAAGSVAKYPNSSTGNATVAGQGVLDGTEAGRVAAINMSKDFSNGYGFAKRDDSICSFAASSLSVWRSDVTSYQGGANFEVSALSSIGVQALCVGNCDSERLATRAFWWTNTSAYRKMNRSIMEDEDEDLVQDEDEVALRRQRTRRRMSRQSRRSGLIAPLFGTGVVYYLDKNGRIRGIMTWGLPFAESEGGEMNGELLRRLKLILAKNAGVSSLDAEENHQVMNTALAKQSQHLVSCAFRDLPADMLRKTHGLDGPISGFSTPLYRYTEVAPSTSSNLSVLKRKEGGGLGVMGEDLFARDEHGLEQEVEVDSSEEKEEVPANIPATSYPITVVPFQVEETYGHKAASLESLKELNRFLALQRGWEENENRARPGKEDVLWLRPGDERKNTSKKQMIIDAYRSIMFAHRSE
eukprot:scaffold73_cov118-Cylindrotheca_fusiformis.AAC.7